MTKSVFRIDPDLIAPEFWTGRDAVVSPGLFGGINSTRSPIESHGFVDSFHMIEMTHISWPGGTLAETAVVRGDGAIQLNDNPAFPYAYDLTYPELLHPSTLVDADGNPTLMAGLGEMIRFAIEHDSSLAIISPTIRYEENPAEGARVLKGFLTDLLVEGRWNDGALPREIVIELGNENYDTDAYALQVVAQLRAVREFREENPDAAFRIAVQAGQDGDSTRALVAAVDDLAGPEHLLAEADMVRVHDLKHSLTTLKDFEHGGKADALHLMATAVMDERALLGITDSPEVDFYLSSWTATSRDVDPDLAAGLPSAGAVLSFFTGLSELGVDLAVAWGIGMDSPTGSPSTISWHTLPDHATFLTPKGAVLAQMAEVLPGMSVVQHPGMDAGRWWPANLHAFADDSKVVLFVAANDLPSARHVVDIELSGFGSFSNVWAESLNVVDGISGTPVLRNPDVAVGENRLGVTLTRDYEIVRIIANKAAPGSDGVWMLADTAGESLTGGNGDDRLDGAAGRDTLAGGAGADRLHGRGNHDLLAGGAGADWLSGGDGDDTLYGGTGDDTLFAGHGTDWLYGGDGDDRLQSGDGPDGLMDGGDGADLFMVDPAGNTVIRDFTPDDGDRLGFGGLYQELDDFRAAIGAVDHTGSGQARDMAIAHAGLGTTVILGGMLMQDAVMTALLDLPALARIDGAAGAGLQDPDDPASLVRGTAAPTEGDLGWRPDGEDPEDEGDEEDEDDGGTGSGACFVATAAWGDRLHPEVVWLRGWRDRVLVRSAPGRAFIRAYWWIGPRLARHVRPDRPSGRLARGVIRAIIAGLRRF